jgi:hypothetical protein
MVELEHFKMQTVSTHHRQQNYRRREMGVSVAVRGTTRLRQTIQLLLTS